MKLIVLTPETTLENEPELINRMFEAGLRRLHLRKPAFQRNDYLKYLEGVHAEFHKYIVIHSCFELFDECRLGGIHLNSAIRLGGLDGKGFTGIPSSQISASFHSWRELTDNDFPFGYVFISPVFDSISKKGYTAAIDLTLAPVSRDQMIRERGYCPAIIGLGGVDGRQIQVLKQAGFDGAAVLGAVWQQGDPVENFGEILAAIS